MATANNDPNPPSFFKVIRFPSSPHLSLPKAFVKTHLKKIPKNPTIKTQTGEHSWKLEIIKIDQDYCFAHGWEKLVQDVQLCSRDIVVFWLIDPFTFQVSFFDAHGCDKELTINNTTNVVDGHDDDNVVDGHDDNVDDDDDSDEAMADENLSFQKVLPMKTYKHYMSLPKKFVVAAGLEHSGGVMVKDHEGKEWIMGIIAERYERTKYSLSKGWTVFRKYHQLSAGDICLFKFNKKEGILYLAQLIKSNAPIKQENPIEAVKKTIVTPPRQDVKIEECSPIVKSCGVKVKIEDQSGPEAGRPPLKQPGGGVKVKIEDGSVPEEVAVKRKRGRPSPGGSGGMEVRVEPVRSKFVVYF